MKVIWEPTVTVMSTQQFHPHPEFLIPDDGDDYTKIGAFAAKGCYDSFGKSGRLNEINQRGVREHAHGSVFEHLYIGLYITGVTRGLTLESNRHRHLNVSQRSTRYTAEEDAAIVLEPYYANLFNRYNPVLTGFNWSAENEREVKDDPEYNLLQDFLNSCEASFGDYEDQVKNLMAINPNKLEGFDLRKWARGKARNVLPHALETRVFYTGNVRAWRWLIEARSDKHAEPEIRRLAYYVYKQLLNTCPLYFEDYYESDYVDGIPVLSTNYRKV